MELTQRIMTQDIFNDKLLTPQEAATLKAVSRTAIYAAISEGRLPAIQILGRLGLRETDVQNWQPCGSKGHVRAKRRSGKPKGSLQTEDAKRRISESQKRRWAQRKELAQAANITSQEL